MRKLRDHWVLLAATVFVSACNAKVGGPVEACDTDENGCETQDDATGPTDDDDDGDSDAEPNAPTGDVDCGSLGANEPTVGPGAPGPLGFPVQHCNPRAVQGPSAYTCCSDDPAAEDGGLPNYMGKNIEMGTVPFFSGSNNALGTSGMCVRTTDIPVGSGLLEPQALHCPIPCNPTWEDGDVAAVCGPARVCCQTRELQPDDCVLDGDIWRPVTGADVGSTAVTPTTTWTPTDHATHQDPSGTGCLTYAGGQQSPAFNDCVASLSVANRRGFCMALGPGQVCPADSPDYVNACDQINLGLIPPPGD